MHFCVWARDLTWAEQEAVIAASVPPRLPAAPHPLLTTLTHHHISRNGYEMVHYLGLLFSKLGALAKFGPWVGARTSTASHLRPIKIRAGHVNSWGVSIKGLCILLRST